MERLCTLHAPPWVVADLLNTQIHHFITMASDERHALPSWQALSPEEWAETTARTYGDESAGLVYGVRNGLSLLMKWASTLVYHD